MKYDSLTATVYVPRDDDTRENHEFMLDEVFWTDTSQEELFTQIGRPLVYQCVEG